jgi:hypothetical protein
MDSSLLFRVSTPLRLYAHISSPSPPPVPGTNIILAVIQYVFLWGLSLPRLAFTVVSNVWIPLVVCAAVRRALWLLVSSIRLAHPQNAVGFLRVTLRLPALLQRKRVWVASGFVCEQHQCGGGVFGAVELEVDRRVADPSELLDAWFGAAMLHCVVGRVIGVEVLHALQVQRLGPWPLSLRVEILVVGGGEVVLRVFWGGVSLYNTLARPDSSLALTYLDNLLRLRHRGFKASTDVDVDVVACICHIGIHIGGGMCSAGVVGESCVGL